MLLKKKVTSLCAAVILCKGLTFIKFFHELNIYYDFILSMLLKKSLCAAVILCKGLTFIKFFHELNIYYDFILSMLLKKSL